VYRTRRRVSSQVPANLLVYICYVVRARSRSMTDCWKNTATTTNQKSSFYVTRLHCGTQVVIIIYYENRTQGTLKKLKRKSINVHDAMEPPVNRDSIYTRVLNM